MASPYMEWAFINRLAISSGTTQVSKGPHSVTRGQAALAPPTRTSPHRYARIEATDSSQLKF